MNAVNNRTLMQRLFLLLCVWVALLPAGGAQSTPVSTGGPVHGTVKAGNVPLPGVSIVATNTLTGQRYATVTDINGNYSMTIPASGRYVLKAELAAFAAETKVAVVKSPAPGSTAAAPVNQQADFSLTLASRVPPETPQQNVAANPGQGARQAGTVRRNTGGGAQNLALMAALAGTEDAGINSGATGTTALPSLANNSDFSTESVAVTGQAGTTNPFAGVDMQQLRDNAELDQSLSGGGGQGGRGQGGGPGGGGPGGGARGGEVLEVAEAALEEAAAASGAEAEEGAAAAVAEEGAVLAAVDSAIFAALNPTSLMAVSFGQVETALSTPIRSPSGRKGSCCSPAMRKTSLVLPS